MDEGLYIDNIVFQSFCYCYYKYDITTSTASSFISFLLSLFALFETGCGMGQPVGTSALVKMI